MGMEVMLGRTKMLGKIANAATKTPIGKLGQMGVDHVVKTVGNSSTAQKVWHTVVSVGRREDDIVSPRLEVKATESIAQWSSKLERQAMKDAKVNEGLTTKKAWALVTKGEGEFSRGYTDALDRLGIPWFKTHMGP